ncbi:hypothetical protein, partial [Anaerotruncus colihominis]|uniref:hypothetical protein n=1 Tax=Anaerotruncus colihominis TaxID=169435 RepID=UPI002941FAF1
IAKEILRILSTVKSIKYIIPIFLSDIDQDLFEQRNIPIVQGNLNMLLEVIRSESHRNCETDR